MPGPGWCCLSHGSLPGGARYAAPALAHRPSRPLDRRPHASHHGRRDFAPYRRSSEHHDRAGRRHEPRAAVSLEDALRGDKVLSRHDLPAPGYAEYLQRHQAAFLKRLAAKCHREAWFLPEPVADAPASDEKLALFERLPLGQLALQAASLQLDALPDVLGAFATALPAPLAFISISNIPPSISHDALLAHLSRHLGPVALRLCDPVAERNYCRQAYVSSPHLDQDSLAKLDAAGSLNGAQLYYSLVLPKEAVKVASLPRAIADLFAAATALLVFWDDQERASLFGAEFASAATDELRLAAFDRLVLYLRIMHGTCLFCGLKAGCTEELLFKCGRLHLYKFEEARSYSLAYLWTDWLAVARSLRALAAKQPGDAPLDTDIDRQLEATEVVKVDEEKFRCAQCQKAFRGPDFVIKHLHLKHADFVKDTAVCAMALKRLLALGGLWLFPESMFPKTVAVEKLDKPKRESSNHATPRAPRHADQPHSRRYVDLDAVKNQQLEISYDF